VETMPRKDLREDRFMCEAKTPLQIAIAVEGRQQVTVDIELTKSTALSRKSENHIL
jgi:hypothetical protein